MTGMHTLAARATLGGVGALGTLLLVRSRRLLLLSQRVFDRGLIAGFLVSRLGLYLLIFFGLHIQPRGDVQAFYVPEAEAVLHHQLPYRDFPSSYAPLHGFLDAGVLAFWHSPLALILFSILVETFALPLLLKAARSAWSEDRVRLAALLFVASPISLQFVTVDGQDNILVAFLLIGALFSLYRGHALTSGALLGSAIVLVKFLPLLFVPVLLMASQRRGRWLVGFVGVLLCGYLPFAMLHLPLLYPLQLEGQAKTASNLPFLIEALCGISLPNRAEDLVLAALLLGTLYVLSRALRAAKDGEARLRIAFAGCVASMLVLLAFSKKSWPPYLVLVLFPVCLLVSGARFGRFRLPVFAGFSWVAILVHSVWATVFLQSSGSEFHASLRAMMPGAVCFFCLQCVLVAGYGWLLVLAVQQSLGARRGAEQPPGDWARPTVCEVKYGIRSRRNEDAGTAFS